MIQYFGDITYGNLAMNGAPLKIILVNPSHPGNIGATARAMKTMGFQDLVLVNPRSFPDYQATVMATHAIDVLEQATLCQTLDEAIKDVSLVMATSARDRSLKWPLIPPAEASKLWRSQPVANSTAIVFGCERNGLSNEDLAKCHFHIQIPTSTDMQSLNLAQAVQVICYQFFADYCVQDQILDQEQPELASAHELEGFYAHLQQMLIHIGFIRPSVPKGLMPRIRRIFQRARLESDEINLLRGICGVVEKETKSEPIEK